MNSSEQKKIRAGKQPTDVAEQTKRDILKASLHCFADEGFKSTTLRKIAEQANTTHGLLRHHFGSKEKLWKACIAFGVEQTTEMQFPLLEEITAENAVESLRLVARALIHNAAKNPDIWRLLMFEALKGGDRLDYMLEVILPMHHKIEPLFNLAQERGHFLNFNHNNFFLYVVSLGALPFAIYPFSNRLCETNVLSGKAAQSHADLVIETLFIETDLTVGV